MNNNYLSDLDIRKNKIRRNRNRRKRQLRFRLFLSSILIMFVCVFGVFGIKASAQSKDDIQMFKYFKSITVSSNDTLWDYAVTNSIDGDYQSYINEVMLINHLYNEELNTGMNLIIPYYSSEFIY